MTHHQQDTIGATALGYPRIGRDRELKTALERFWGASAAERPDLPAHAAGLQRTASAVRHDAWRAMADAGLDSVPLASSLYDHVLDACLMVGAVPARFADLRPGPVVDGLDTTRCFAMARGTGQVAPLEMTKWFDTNYHHLVPEVDADAPFSLDPGRVLAELAEARAAGVRGRPVVVGPFTLLRVAKAAAGAPDGFRPLNRLAELTEVYADLLGEVADAGAGWVQLDEPAAVLDLTAEEVAALGATYERLARETGRPGLLVATYFGTPVEALPALARSGVDAIGLDLVRGPEPDDVAGTPGLRGTHLVLGAVDGRNVWRTDLRAALLRLEEWAEVGAGISVSTSCSLLHVPHDVARESALDPRLRTVLAFADQKLAEVATLQHCLDRPGTDDAERALAASDGARDLRAAVPGLHVEAVAERQRSVGPSDRERPDRRVRAEAQDAALRLPPLPTTTIGSFPQTADVRRARAARRAGRLDDAAYVATMRAEIERVVRLQESVGLDVLVHGEPERNDMVQYFAEQLDGYATTVAGWVQSYGSRCVRPPVLYGDVARPEPMTVPWWAWAQGLTDKPVKGMLTGPVTMLAWSFVRDDQPRATTADQVALALRDEVADLERAGAAIVQVDEPALRELLPLRASDRPAYLAWSVGAFRLATAGVADATAVHTHLCYSEFGEVVAAIDDLDADVTSVEAARSGMELLRDVDRAGFSGGLGPGVYDIHSPRVPSEAEVGALLVRALRTLGADRLWVNPDCGLKTRAYAEVEPALRRMVGAAHTVRQTLTAAV